MRWQLTAIREVFASTFYSEEFEGISPKVEIVCETRFQKKHQDKRRLFLEWRLTMYNNEADRLFKLWVNHMADIDLKDGKVTYDEVKELVMQAYQMFKDYYYLNAHQTVLSLVSIYKFLPEDDWLYEIVDGINRV
jgi:hypothetical protein